MNISAALLAGGESRRMGQDKATLVFHGKPLWQIQLDLLRKLRPREIFLSARTDPGWRPADVHFVPDQTPSRGPLSGLAATLARIQTDHLLALAIDMPLMTEDFLRSLCGVIKPSCGVAPMIGDRAEPLAAIYPKGADSDVIAALSGPLACLRMRKITFEILISPAILCEFVPASYFRRIPRMLTKKLEKTV